MDADDEIYVNVALDAVPLSNTRVPAVDCVPAVIVHVSEAVIACEGTDEL